MTKSSEGAPSVSNANLAAELRNLSVPFVAASSADHSATFSHLELVAGLASSDEARLRLSLIPLFIMRSECADVVSLAADGLSEQARVTLACYYTAAVLLQHKYRERLARLGLDSGQLPGLFGQPLGLPLTGNPDALLRLLAERQADLTGRRLNWYGTYEHAVERLMQRMELEEAWSRS